MVYRDCPYSPRYTNKHTWIYKFSYKSNIWGKKIYEIETNYGFQIAEYYAENNMNWDGSKDLQFISKRRK